MSAPRNYQLVDPVLTNIARQYRPVGFIADTIIPRVGVQKEAGKYVTFPSRAFFATDVDYKKPDRAQTKEVDFDFSTEPYSVEEYAVKVSISRRERENADQALRLEANKLALLQDQLALAREVRCDTLLRTQDNGGQLDNAMDATPTNNWDTDAATIESDIKTAIEAVRDEIGREPNTIVIPYKVANAIAIQQDIREILKYTVNGQQILSEGAAILPRQLWGLNVVVPTARKFTNVEGATDAATDVWGDDVRVLYLADNAEYGIPSVAYTFQTRPVQIRRYLEFDPEVEYIIASEVVDERCVAPKAGYVIRDVLS